MWGRSRGQRDHGIVCRLLSRIHAWSDEGLVCGLCGWHVFGCDDKCVVCLLWEHSQWTWSDEQQVAHGMLVRNRIRATQRSASLYFVPGWG